MCAVRIRFGWSTFLSLLFNKGAVRRHADRRILWQMTTFTLLLTIINLLFIYAVAHGEFFEQMKAFLIRLSLDDRDVAVMALIGFSAIVLIIGFYVMQVHRLIKDIQRLAELRDRAIEIKSQRQKLEALGQLSAGISHEINTCLQSILVSCELAKNATDNPEALNRCLDKAVRNSYHARRVVENVLAFSEQGGALQVVPCRIESLLADAVDYSRTFLPTAVNVTQDIAPDLHDVEVDRSAFIHIIQNLLNNAAHAMDFTGDIKLSCLKELELEQDNAFNLKPGTYTECLVADTGRGIPPEQVEKIFEPFFTTKGGQGTGLGLSIVYGMMEAMGGHISVLETAAGGTTFRLMLPTIRTLP